VRCYVKKETQRGIGAFILNIFSMNKNIIGIRREDKNQWERRVSIIPELVRAILAEHGTDVIVQPSAIRVFSDEAYRDAGAVLDKNLARASVIFGVKEIPSQLLEAQKTYVFFSHTVKGQACNMPMLRRLMELGCTLIDYEKITDEAGRRLVFFGRHAGLAGMIDTLWALGQRLEWEGVPNPFTMIKQAYHYRDLDEARDAVSAAGEAIRRDGLHESLKPLSIAFTGYGNVSRGAQEIFDLLPFREVSPKDLAVLENSGERHLIYKAVFREADMVVSNSGEADFSLEDYYAHPKGYRSVFHNYLEHLTAVINGIYWEQKYPRLITRNHLRKLFEEKPSPRLRLISDISCDVEGSIECTLKATTPDHPVFVYDPIRGEMNDDLGSRGVVVLAVDNLPCELPRDSSVYFSGALAPFIPAIIAEDFTVEFEKSTLPQEIKRAMILCRGELTPHYQYMASHLKAHSA